MLSGCIGSYIALWRGECTLAGDNGMWLIRELTLFQSYFAFLRCENPYIWVSPLADSVKVTSIPLGQQEMSLCTLVIIYLFFFLKFVNYSWYSMLYQFPVYSIEIRQSHTKWSPQYFQYLPGSIHSYYNIIVIIIQFIYLFTYLLIWERGREGEREREKHQVKEKH